MNSVYVYVGNGAVGTTTCAGATGVALADDGAETAVVSFDPLESLSKAVETAVGPEPTPIREGLTGVEISPEAGQETYTELFDALADHVSAAGIDLSDGHVANLVRNERIPLGREVAALEAVASFVRDPHYDAVVFDTGPEATFLQLLRKPGMVGMGLSVAQDLTNQLERAARDASDRFPDPLPWDDGSGSDRGSPGPAANDASRSGREDRRGTGADGENGGGNGGEAAEPPPEADEEIKRRVERVRTTLGGAGRRQLRVVTTPEDVSVRYIDWRAANITNAGIPSGPLFVNQVVEDPHEGCPRCRARHERHREVVENLRTKIDDLDLCVLPDCRGEADGVAMLELLAEEIPTRSPA